MYHNNLLKGIDEIHFKDIFFRRWWKEPVLSLRKAPALLNKIKLAMKFGKEEHFKALGLAFDLEN